MVSLTASKLGLNPKYFGLFTVNELENEVSGCGQLEGFGLRLYCIAGGMKSLPSKNGYIYIKIKFS